MGQHRLAGAAVVCIDVTGGDGVPLGVAVALLARCR